MLRALNTSVHRFENAQQVNSHTLQPMNLQVAVTCIKYLIAFEERSHCSLNAGMRTSHAHHTHIKRTSHAHARSVYVEVKSIAQKVLGRPKLLQRSHLKRNTQLKRSMDANSDGCMAKGSIWIRNFITHRVFCHAADDPLGYAKQT